VHHVGILYDQFMMHGQRNIKKKDNCDTSNFNTLTVEYKIKNSVVTCSLLLVQKNDFRFSV